MHGSDEGHPEFLERIDELDPEISIRGLLQSLDVYEVGVRQDLVIHDVDRGEAALLSVAHQRDVIDTPSAVLAVNKAEVPVLLPGRIQVPGVIVHELVLWNHNGLLWIALGFLKRRRDQTPLWDEGSIEEMVFVCQKIRRTRYWRFLKSLIAEGNRGNVQGGRGSVSRGRQG